jgi:hypothetical protein
MGKSFLKKLFGTWASRVQEPEGYSVDDGKALTGADVLSSKEKECSDAYGSLVEEETDLIKKIVVLAGRKLDLVEREVALAGLTNSLVNHELIIARAKLSIVSEKVTLVEGGGDLLEKGDVVNGIRGSIEEMLVNLERLCDWEICDELRKEIEPLSPEASGGAPCVVGEDGAVDVEYEWVGYIDLDNQIVFCDDPLP